MGGNSGLALQQARMNQPPIVKREPRKRTWKMLALSAINSSTTATAEA